MNKPVKHFDLPKQHLTGEHYVPTRARRSEEIERRRSLRRGTILLEQQSTGFAIMSHIVENIDEDEDLLYVSDILAASALNASWYGFAQNAPGMRRRLYLPEFADDETGWRENRAGLLTKVRFGLANVAEHAAAIAQANAEGNYTARQSFELGLHMGSNALKLACVPMSNATYGMSAHDAQFAARDQSLAVLWRSRALIDEVGVNVSVAQLADPDSPAAVHVRRTAPNNVHNLFEEKTEEIRREAA